MLYTLIHLNTLQIHSDLVFSLLFNQMRVANIAVRALKDKYGTYYRAGSSSVIICKYLSVNELFPITVFEFVRKEGCPITIPL